MPHGVSDKLLNLILENPTASAKEIAEIYGCCAGYVCTVKSELRKEGFNIPMERVKGVKAAVLANPGASAREIADMTGCAIDRARHVISAVKQESFSLEAKLAADEAKPKEPEVPPSVRAFRSMMDGFIRQIQMFMQTNEIDSKEALGLLEETHEKMKEEIRNDT